MHKTKKNQSTGNETKETIKTILLTYYISTTALPYSVSDCILNLWFKTKAARVQTLDLNTIVLKIVITMARCQIPSNKTAYGYPI